MISLPGHGAPRLKAFQVGSALRAVAGSLLWVPQETLVRAVAVVERGSRAMWWLACSALSHTVLPAWGGAPLPFSLPAISMSLVWEAYSQRVWVPGPTGLLGAPSPHCLPSCQAISLHSYLEGNRAKSLSAGATMDFTSDTDLAPCHQLSQCWPGEGTEPLLLTVQPLPAVGLVSGSLATWRPGPWLQCGLGPVRRFGS